MRHRYNLLFWEVIVVLADCNHSSHPIDVRDCSMASGVSSI